VLIRKISTRVPFLNCVRILWPVKDIQTLSFMYFHNLFAEWGISTIADVVLLQMFFIAYIV